VDDSAFFPVETVSVRMVAVGIIPFRLVHIMSYIQYGHTPVRFRFDQLLQLLGIEVLSI
jgi:hypothetical protein